MMALNPALDALLKDASNKHGAISFEDQSAALYDEASDLAARAFELRRRADALDFGADAMRQEANRLLVEDDDQSLKATKGRGA